MGHKAILLEKKFGLSHRSKVERKVKKRLEMMNHLTSTYENRLG